MNERTEDDIPAMSTLKISFLNAFEDSWQEESISDDEVQGISLLEMNIELTKTLTIAETASLHGEVMIGDYFRVKSVLDRGCNIDALDASGATPLQTAVKKVSTSRKYLAIVSLLLSYGADPHQKDSDGWSTMDEAVARQDRELVGLLFDFMSAKRLMKFQEVKTLTSQALQRLQDFYLEIKWEFDSSIIPLVSSFGPSDICSMWKSRDCLRLDSSLVGWKKFISKRREMSIIFKNTGSQHDLVLVNHSKRILSDPLEPVDPEERTAVLGDIMRADPVQGEVSFHNYRITQTKSWRGKPQTANISGYFCVKYKVKLQARLNYKKKARKTNPNAEAGPEKHVRTEKNLKAIIWVSSQFPISFKDFLPMLALLSQANTTMSKLYEFMSNGSLIKQLPPGSFPVKIDIPISMSIRAVIHFTNFHVKTPDPAVFALPNYEWQSRKVAQKTLSCPRKRMFLANMAV
eukprot:CAMPEP_0204916738 /NCGR_PEP_ID=MMETSP1397-20131031/14489_1 /ASSEMBLY_ACC=CAM_ASM_000891 /TAXON_ID=49980 /ORGANISM="Climacostomum Climacostomum virens, Strain Stock W-24" /LENGTH=460 /DNA_ID=CAMNT_0052089359 /DNA_START=177 /DNA_END=1555 /DNA_ORIENTATION=-